MIVLKEEPDSPRFNKLDNAQMATAENRAYNFMIIRKDN